jgi:hypothetical protein
MKFVATGGRSARRQALIGCANGRKSDGFDRRAAGVSHEASLAASHPSQSVPEFYCAPERSDSNFPAQYPGANLPHPGPASSVFTPGFIGRPCGCAAQHALG